jgi:FAD:protein FMN transferase
MGTVASVDIIDADEAIFKDVFAWFYYVNEHFSIFNDQSEISLYNRREIAKPSEDLEYLVNKSAEYKKETSGYFSANFDGRFNPTGLVKGWAIKRVGELIKTKGFEEFMINIGGDILASGQDKTWRIGVQNPAEKGAVLGVIEAKNLAVATSGLYERGKHIINPKDGSEATGVLSVTVTGPDIETADVYATAICAMGPIKGLDHINSTARYEAMIIGQDFKVFESDNFLLKSTS